MKKNKDLKKRKRKLTIALLYHFLSKRDKTNYYSPEYAVVDGDTFYTVKALSKLLLRKGFKVQVIKVEPDDLTNLRDLKVDFIFNLVDSRAMEMQIARILDRLKVPHSGSSYAAIQASNNKVQTKQIFLKHGLPTPPYTILRPKDHLTKSILPAKFPLIAKLAYEHCSIGITEKSIAQTFKQLKSIVKRLRVKYKQTLLIEQFIKGKEYQVTVLESNHQTTALPIAEINFRNNVKNKWNIYGFDAKWNIKEELYKYCQFISPPRNIYPEIDQKIRREAIRAFYAIGLKDYARFDLRYNPKAGKWYWLEANANAGLSPNSEDALAASVKAFGMTFDDFVLQILKNSLIKF